MDVPLLDRTACIPDRYSSDILQKIEPAVFLCVPLFDKEGAGEISFSKGWGYRSFLSDSTRRSMSSSECPAVTVNLTLGFFTEGGLMAGA